MAKYFVKITTSRAKNKAQESLNKFLEGYSRYLLTSESQMDALNRDIDDLVETLNEGKRGKKLATRQAARLTRDGFVTIVEAKPSSGESMAQVDYILIRGEL